jgi:hypothetical protein
MPRPWIFFHIVELVWSIALPYVVAAFNIELIPTGETQIGWEQAEQLARATYF